MPLRAIFLAITYEQCLSGLLSVPSVTQFLGYCLSGPDTVVVIRFRSVHFWLYGWCLSAYSVCQRSLVAAASQGHAAACFHGTLSVVVRLVQIYHRGVERGGMASQGRIVTAWSVHFTIVVVTTASQGLVAGTARSVGGSWDVQQSVLLSQGQIVSQYAPLGAP